MNNPSGGVHCTPADIARVILALQRWLVVSHYSPDPDAYGSSCAMALALQRLGKTAVCLNESGVLAAYAFIPGVEAIRSEMPEGTWDGVIICDCGDTGRLGEKFGEFLLALGAVINIDHHISNTGFGHFNLVRGDASSSAELVLEVIDALGVSLDAELATCLLTGLMADTGLFRYSSVTARSFETARRLVEAGAAPHRIARALYGDRRLAAVRLQAEALRQMTIFCEGRVSEVIVTAEMLSQFEASGEDCENLVEAARDIAGVAIALSLRDEKGVWKVSLRSKEPVHNVSEVAADFGGGGHCQAAAFRWRQGLDDLLPRLHARVAVELEKGS